MNDRQKKVLFEKIKNAWNTKTPEDIFESLPGKSGEQLEAAKVLYRKFARLVHPDRNSESLRAEAEAAFAALSQIWKVAQEKIAAGSYGKRSAKAVSSSVVVPTMPAFHTRKFSYVLTIRIGGGGMCGIFSGVVF